MKDAGSGHCRTLPWAAREGDDACLYLGITRPSPEKSGDLVLLDELRPEHQLHGNEFVFFRIPYSYLGIAQDEARHLAGRRVSAAGGVAALVSKFMSALIGAEGLWDSAHGNRLALNAVDLVALLVAELLAPRRAETSENGSAMLARIRSYIDENLMDPDLSPESVARAHHISVRYLHKLFQADGTTVSTHIRQSRLAACRTDLGRPSNSRRSVAAVAQIWGFTSPSHFSRLFRQTYGLTPTEWQVSASRQSS
ncbi:helix-turn-helix domain-containing protein [Streptomyces sp. KL116D]|uniref:helix-turn-helix domain-containing protein n=1 Tax=Streptomyces sp. KL116D TaxID=3045152 RepID=UPI0035569F74